MKRELLCFRCGSAPLGKFQGEGWKKFLGRLKLDCLCDGCGKQLRKDTVAIAQSIYVEGFYFDWEDEFIAGKLATGGA